MWFRLSVFAWRPRKAVCPSLPTPCRLRPRVVWQPGFHYYPGAHSGRWKIIGQVVSWTGSNCFFPMEPRRTFSFPASCVMSVFGLTRGRRALPRLMERSLWTGTVALSGLPLEARLCLWGSPSCSGGAGLSRYLKAKSPGCLMAPSPGYFLMIFVCGTAKPQNWRVLLTSG